MKRAKKDRPKVAAFEQSRPGLQPRNEIYDYYIKFPTECKPIFGVPARPAAWGEEEGMERAESSLEAGTEQSGISSDEDGGGGALPMSGWVLALTVIGTGWLTRQLFHIVDWIERR